VSESIYDIVTTIIKADYCLCESAAGTTNPEPQPSVLLIFLQLTLFLSKTHELLAK